MRLEIEPTSAVPPSAESVSPNGLPDEKIAASQEHLKNGIKAAQSGRRADARTELLRATELDPRSENAWLWLASISEYPEELLVFLNNVLEINPSNARALEWRSATNSLLAKTLIQRGIDAAEEGQKDQAAELFGKALEYDQQSALAWMWMASLSDSNEGKLLYLEKALSIDPDNATAVEAYKSARKAITSGHLADAKAAAVAGRNDEARELLEAVLEEMPDSEDAWMLKSHFADSFAEKMASFERVLEINPSNAAAAASLESLRSLAGIAPAEAEEAEPEMEAVEVVEEVQAESQDEGPGSAEAAMFDGSFASEKEPTQDLEMPAGVQETFEAYEAAEVVEEVSYEAAEPEAEHVEAVAEEAEEEIHFEAAEIVESSSDDEAVADDGHAEYSPEPDMNMTMFGSHFSPFPSYDGAENGSSVEEMIADSAFGSDDDSIEEVHVGGAEVSDPVASAADDESFDPYSTLVSINPIDTGFEAPTQEALDDEPIVASTPFDAPAAEEMAEEEDPIFSQTMYVPSADPFSAEAPTYVDSIPMPDAELKLDPIPASAISEMPRTGFETFVVRDQPATPAATTNCPFCKASNDVLAITCMGCMAVLTLSDLEMVLSNQIADKLVIQNAVEQMEIERKMREFSEEELTMLGIGHLNLKNHEAGFAALQEASRLNPNNVVLSSHVNSLLIRMEEMKARQESHGEAASGKRILVVDDSPTIRKLISGKLEKCGHEVFCSSDGVEAIARLEEFTPDLVLLDITMPRMDGYQVCKLIRSGEKTKDIPVIMISGKDGFFDKVRGRMAGSSGYITKPFGPETLMKVVDSYLQNPTQIEVE